MSQQRLLIAEKFFAALRAKDIDAALELMSEDAVMASPVGKKKGKDKCRGMLRVISNFGGGNATDMQMAGEDVTCITKSPMGKTRLTVAYNSSDQISEIQAKLGG